MKVIHIADIHWRGLSRHDEYRESFSKFFEQARSLNPDIIYVGGDIVHNKTQGISPELIDSLCWWFNGLSDIAPTHVILGNHDGLVLNKDRQDAITPVLDALNKSNIFLYKQSGVYPIDGHDNFNWCVLSCFDEEGWKSASPQDDKINIALFHGAVWGSKTDIDWDIEGDVTIDLFDSFDFGMLGDIHKKQFLNVEKTVAYPGSTIQQNYGEDIGKGFLFWDIRDRDDFDVEFFEIPHSSPFITIDWRGSVSETVTYASKYPNGSRFRIKSKNVLTHADSRHIHDELKTFKLASEVVFKADATFDASKINTGLGSLSKENLRDSSTHKKLIREYYRDRDVSEENFKELDTLIDFYMSQITDDQEILRNVRWQINSLKFDNMFSYGKRNTINFENLPGITGIFGTNTKGKSSIIGSLMYSLFNTTDRGSIKNIHIVNSRKNSCVGVVDLSISGTPFRIKRSTTKHQTRKGAEYASTSLNLYKLDSSGNIVEDLTEEQRRETEKVLRKMIGTSDDFLMTSLASQGAMNTFIKEGATSRKMILTKFLDLGVFEKMHDIAKSESSDIRNKIRLYPDIDWDEAIDSLNFNISEKEKEITDIDDSIRECRKTLSKLNVDLATSDNPDIVTKEEYDIQEKNIVKIKERLDKQTAKRDNLEKDIRIKNDKFSKINRVKSDFSISSLREKEKIQANLERALIDLQYQYESYKNELSRQERSVKKLNEVPCGDTYPLCKFIKDSHNDKGLINSQRELVEKSLGSLEAARESFITIRDESVREKIDKYESLARKQSEILIDISEIKISLNNTINEMDRYDQDLRAANQKLSEMSSRLAIGEESASTTISFNISSLRVKIENLDQKRISHLESLAENRVSVSRYETDKSQFKNFKKKLKAYDIFMQAVSKKGIPLQIMMSQLPLINTEISKILQGVVGFTVELEADPESNAMDVFINYGDSKRVIELASGMEKMMSSLAIRVALINVSSLTKTNTLIIDEGFGALDETNIEACNRLLMSLKKWFRNIFVISHVDAIKDSVDNSLEIIKNGKDSKINSY